MSTFSPHNFFDLSSFQHASIFDKCQFVWEAIAQIKVYLAQGKLGKIEGDISSQAYLISTELISIGKNSIVEPGAYIKGPCIIGENCTIRHGAYIRGDFIAGNGCVIGHDTEIKNCLFLNDVHAAHFAYLGDSILGNQVNLGAGTKCANLKLNRSEIIVRDKGQRILTGLKKFGAIVGDGTQTGCNSVTNPGTIMGKNVVCFPCLNIGGYVPAGSVCEPSNKIRIYNRI